MRCSLLLLPFLVLLIGCGGSQTALLAQRQAGQLDSLYAANVSLRQELSTLRDSLQFYDDVESGQYYRDRRVRQAAIDRLEYALAQCRDGGQTAATLSVDELFEPASAVLTARGHRLLDALAQRLGQTAAEAPLRVEGHADNVPLGPRLTPRYPSNWELSTARAAAVARYLIDAHAVAPERFEVVGLGATRPLARNDTAEGRRRNRRVRVVILPPPDDASTPAPAEGQEP